MFGINTINAKKEMFGEVAAVVQQRSDSKEDADELIDAVSILSTLDEECYHTQGAYVHVVMCMMSRNESITKQLTKEMLVASMLENMCFAFTHPTKGNKYLGRVADACRWLVLVLPNGFEHMAYNTCVACLNEGDDILKKLENLYMYMGLRQGSSR